MFYPQEMTEVEMVILEKDVLTITRLLVEEQVLHQTDASYLTSGAEADRLDYWRKQSMAYAALERRILDIMKALEVEERPGLATAEVELVAVETLEPLIERLEKESHKLTEELAEDQKKLEQLQRYLYQLEPIAEVEIEIGAMRNLRYLFAMLGIMPVENIERLETSLVHIPSLLLPLRELGQRAVVLLLGMQRDSEMLQRAARSAYLNPLRLPEAYQGTPAQVIQAIHADMERIQQHMVERKAVITELHDARSRQLQTLLARVRASRIMADAIAHCGHVHDTYIVTGWVPTHRLDQVIRQLRGVSREILIEVRQPKRHAGAQDVPISLDNPGFLRAFQGLVTNYGWPNYGEIDPTLLISLTFPLLFGIMFGDVGHGLLLALLGGLLVSRKVRALQGLADLGPLVLLCGLVSMVFGVLYGSVFGLESVLPVLWLRPLQSIMQILMVTVGVGIVLLSLGFLVHMLNAWRARDWGRLFFGHYGLAGLVLYWSLLGLVASALTSLPIQGALLAVLAGLSGLAVMLSELLGRLVTGRRPLIEGSKSTYFVQGFFELFEMLISLLSNTLSYVRVGAFAVAHGGLSAVFLILADSFNPGAGLGYWLIVALGNLFVVGFEGLIVAIQTMRLEYYEFFSKFFEDGGRRYAPLSLPSSAYESS
ncbi:MAG: V-type ATP synthase subunit I [Anaerolineae bacterium]